MRNRVLLLLCIVLGCNDATVATRTEPPSATILAPADGSSMLEAREVVFEGRVSDTFSDADDLTLAWTSSRDGTLATGAPVDGTTTFATTALSVGVHTIELSVADEDGTAGSDSIQLSVIDDAPPSVTIEEPGAGPFEAGALIPLLARVDDAEDPLETLRVSWAVQGEPAPLVEDLAPTSNGEALSSTTLSTGTWTLVATVTDSLGQTALDTVSVAVEDPPPLNTPPTADLTDPADLPSAGDSVVLEGVVSDAQDDPQDLVVTWASDLEGALGSSTPDGTGSVETTVVLGAGDHTLTLAVEDSGGLAASDSTTLHVNAPPSLLSVSVAPTTADVTTTLTASATPSDPDGDPVNVTWQWMVNGNPVPGATGTTLAAPDFAHFDDVQVVATPWDPLTFGASMSSNSVTIGNLPPTAPTISVSPGAPEPGDDLVCSIISPATDPDGDTLTYTLSWTEAGGTSGGSATGDATTTASVSSSLTSDGDVWTCDVSADDGTTSGPAATASVSVVATGSPLCPSGFSLAFDITDDASDQMVGGCDWLWWNLFSLSDTISLQWWATDGTSYGPSTWNLASEMASIQANYASCGSSGGDNYAMGSTDGLWYLTLVQYNDLLHITAWGDDPANGTDYYYGRISAGYSSNDEIYAVGYADWSDAWNNRFEDGDRFVACYQ